MSELEDYMDERDGRVRVGGVDPGPAPGLIVLYIADGQLYRVERGPHLTWQRVVATSTHVAVEAYVRGRISTRSHSSAAQLTTQSMARDVGRACVAAQRVWTKLPAGSVKPWADDERLRTYKVGAEPRANQHEDARPTLYELTRGGGGHDRDAARHALRFAVALGFLPKR